MTAAVLLGGCAKHSPHAPGLHAVAIRGFHFVPESLAIAPGDTVEWRNEDLVPHTSTALDSTWDSGSLMPGESWRTVPALGSPTAYHCRLHPTMQAKLAIR